MKSFRKNGKTRMLMAGLISSVLVELESNTNNHDRFVNMVSTYIYERTRTARAIFAVKKDGNGAQALMVEILPTVSKQISSDNHFSEE